jgi:hypothetical protein
MTVYAKRNERLVIGENVYALNLASGQSLKDKLMEYAHLLDAGDRVEIFFDDGRTFNYIYKAGKFIKLKAC